MTSITIALLLALAASTFGEDTDRVQLTLNASEADAALLIMEKRAAGGAVADADWERLFSTEPYVRLKQREAAMHRAFTDDEFKKFVLSDDVIAHAPELRRTLERWKKADLIATARRILPYLPADARVRAQVYPVIKPQRNSFVFEINTNPAIFLYVDPKISPAEFENTVAHESHHIGFSDVNAKYEERIKPLPQNARKAAEWMGAFGEGMAVLAAAGSADVHPMRDLAEKDRVRWDLDMQDADRQIENLNQFFLDTVNGGFAKPEVADHVAFMFFGYRGPWYTVGYKMGSMVEKRFGRAVLVECMADPRQLLAKYNQAASEENRTGKEGKLPLWSSDLLLAVGVQTAEAGH
jgi:hypothetical protein